MDLGRPRQMGTTVTGEEGEAATTGGNVDDNMGWGRLISPHAMLNCNSGKYQSQLQSSFKISKKTRKRLHSLCWTELRISAVVTETLTEVGDPKEIVCQTVEKLDIQLLVLGSHGRGALKRAFLGSVSNYCVHNAKCPVLVVRKPD
ncbi:hypothetical protein RJ640_017972 [Escallonia rubra]|uniref:UspA domain-containing protein n=1 Tax=Escallonia rubra TaxID=112253 RepID=A0AA88R0T9_9ASTE|nr:hypothetical protein RJ640_017972 [Escallonia rubra]